VAQGGLGGNMVSYVTGQLEDIVFYVEVKQGPDVLDNLKDAMEEDGLVKVHMWAVLPSFDNWHFKTIYDDAIGIVSLTQQQLLNKEYV
jgi:hypothetical protein